MITFKLYLKLYRTMACKKDHECYIYTKMYVVVIPGPASISLLPVELLPRPVMPIRSMFMVWPEMVDILNIVMAALV